MDEVEKIKKLFKEKFPNYPVLAIWDAKDFYLVSIEIISGKELSDGYFKVNKNNIKLDESWGYQSNLKDFKKIIQTPAIFIRK